MKHKIAPYADQLLEAVDRIDPDAAATAIELQFPETFSHKAWRVIRYFAGAMYLFSYKGQFVVTDESLELTVHDGEPVGGPRWTGKSMDDLEHWLELIADEYDASDYEIPGWEVELSSESVDAHGPGWQAETPAQKARHRSECQQLDSDVMVKLIPDGEYIGIKTYDRQHGSHGRFLIAQSSLWALGPMLKTAVGKSMLDVDCGNIVDITNVDNGLLFRFAWLNTHSDNSVTGFKQEITIPGTEIIRALRDNVECKVLCHCTHGMAKIDATRAVCTIQKIQRNKRVRRAFAKAMRDCFQWPGERITLYPDGKYSFFFTTRSGYPKNGGLILHKGEKDGHPYLTYSVHT